MSYEFGGWDSRFGDVIGTTQTGWPIAVYPPEPCGTRFLCGVGSYGLASSDGRSPHRHAIALKQLCGRASRSYVSRLHGRGIRGTPVEAGYVAG